MSTDTIIEHGSGLGIGMVSISTGVGISEDRESIVTDGHKVISREGWSGL